MARIVRPQDGLPLSRFDEETFPADVPEEDGTTAVATELVTPEDVLRRARTRAADLMAEAEAQAAEMRAAAEAAGREAGRATGAAEGAARHDEAAQTLRAVADAVVADRDRATAELVQHVTTIALAIVQRVLGDLVGAKPEVMRHVVEQVLGALHSPESVRVHVHPSVVDVVEQEREALRRTHGDGAVLEIVGDESVAPGGCLLDAGSLQIDATVESVIARLQGEFPADAGTEAPAAPREEGSA